MNLLEGMNAAIMYIEAHLLDNLNIKDVARRIPLQEHLNNCIILPHLYYIRVPIPEIEFYHGDGDFWSEDLKSEIWIPIEKKE